ncbi:crotonase/enoyl-CoA hydratase family protein [bacterium]|nr:crotonase/enoyl-CoA hydratase family protein [bacterium]
MQNYETLLVTVTNHVAHIIINRPQKANAMNQAFWTEIKQVCEWVDKTPDVRVAIISGNGPHFTAGIDLQMLMGFVSQTADNCEGRKRENIRLAVLELQSSFTAIEKCRKPIIAAIHGGCIGGGVDMVSACDMRFCTADAFFTIKEIDMGMTADVGTLQRLPHLIGDGIMREMAYTGRHVYGPEAKEIGLVNRTFATKEDMLAEVTKLAQTIAAKSPLSIRGTKEIIVYTRDHPVADSLNYIATWNAAMLLSNDIQEGMMAAMEKREPIFKG